MLKYDFDALYERLKNLEGKPIWIVESISRNREAGHDRHFATQSGFMLTVKFVGWAISGANYHLLGMEGFSYSLSSEHIVEFTHDDVESFTVVEHFETKTERKTTFSLASASAINEGWS
jgi:hypothetical protein